MLILYTEVRASPDSSIIDMKGDCFMNCLCNLFDNNTLTWIVIIALLLILFCNNGCTSSGYGTGCGCGC